MSNKLSDEEIGAICALIGKNRSAVDPQYLPGYDAKVEAMRAEAARLAAQSAEYNRLAELGHTEEQIKILMGL